MSKFIFSIVFSQSIRMLKAMVLYYTRLKALLALDEIRIIKIAFQLAGVKFPYDDNKDLVLKRDRKGVRRWYIKYGTSLKRLYQKQFSSSRISRLKSRKSQRNRRSL